MEKDVVTQLEQQLEERIRQSSEKFSVDMSNHNERMKSSIDKYGSYVIGAALPAVAAFIVKSIFGF